MPVMYDSARAGVQYTALSAGYVDLTVGGWVLVKESEHVPTDFTIDVYRNNSWVYTKLYTNVVGGWLDLTEGKPYPSDEAGNLKLVSDLRMATGDKLYFVVSSASNTGKQFCMSFTSPKIVFIPNESAEDDPNEISGVENPADMQIPGDTALEQLKSLLPATVTAIHNGGQSRSEVPVVWTADVLPEENGSRTYMGALDLSGSELFNPYAYKVSVTVFRPVNPLRITEVVNPAGISVDYGLTLAQVKAKLPGNVTVKYNSGMSSASVPVTWNVAALPEEFETLAYTGSLNLQGTSLMNENNFKAAINITRGEDPVIVKTITMKFNAYTEFKGNLKAAAPNNDGPNWFIGTTDAKGSFTVAPNFNDLGGGLIYSDPIWNGTSLVCDENSKLMTDEYVRMQSVNSSGRSAIQFVAPMAGNAMFTLSNSFCVNGGEAYISIYQNGKKIWPANKAEIFCEKDWNDDKLLYNTPEGLSLGEIKKGDTFTIVVRAAEGCEWIALALMNPTVKLTTTVNRDISSVISPSDIILASDATLETLRAALPSTVKVTFDQGKTTANINVVWQEVRLPEPGGKLVFSGALDLVGSGLKNSASRKASVTVSRLEKSKINFGKYKSWKQYPAIPELLENIKKGNNNGPNWKAVLYRSYEQIVPCTIFGDLFNDKNRWMLDESQIGGVKIPEEAKELFIGTYIDIKAGLVFAAPENGMVKLLPEEKHTKIIVSSQRSDKSLDGPVYLSVWRNGEKVWPEDSDGCAFKPGVEHEFPDIPEIPVNQGDSVFLLANGELEYSTLSLKVSPVAAFKSGEGRGEDETPPVPEGEFILEDAETGVTLRYEGSVFPLNSRLVVQKMTDGFSVDDAKGAAGDSAEHFNYLLNIRVVDENDIDVMNDGFFMMEIKNGDTPSKNFQVLYMVNDEATNCGADFYGGKIAFMANNLGNYAVFGMITGKDKPIVSPEVSPEEGGSPVWVYAVIGGAAVILLGGGAAAGTVFYQKRKKGLV